MSKRRFVAGERHHWWPKSLSSRWADASGLIQRIDPAGTIVPTTPTNAAVISDGHNIKVGSPWDSTFEDEFDKPDSNFPYIVEYLEGIAHRHEVDPSPESHGFCAHDVDEVQIDSLVECLVSLAVRSPKFRNHAVGTAKFVRSEVPKIEHKILSAANIQQTYVGLKRNLSGRGKFVLVFSQNREFIFGDGFYNNVTVGSMNTFNTRILAPLTPKLSVLYASPMQYMVEPRLVTLEADTHLLELFNNTVQVYSKDYLFFRSEEPMLTEHFRRREHLEYGEGDPIEELAQRIPGVRTRSIWGYA